MAEEKKPEADKNALKRQPLQEERKQKLLQNRK